MKRSGIILALLLGAALLPAQDVFRTDVQLVHVLATVKNAAGQLIGSLSKQDFQLFDNGVPQELSVFEHHTEQPLSVAMLVDTSASTAIDLRYETDSVAKFLRALFAEGNAKDAVALYNFNYDVTMLSSYTRRLERLEQHLKVLKPVGGTSLYDAIYLSARELEDRDGRHVIVLVTDGGDTTSGATYHEALQAAQRADAIIYPVLVMPITNDPGRNIGGENALTTLAASTGGRVFLPPGYGAPLDSAFAEILRDLRTQYLLGYYPKNLPSTKERFHKLEIKLKQSDLRVLARNGYYGDSEQGRGWVPAK